MDDTTGRRISELSLSSRQGTGMAADNSSSSSSSNLQEDQNTMRRSNSKDLILELVPAPVETIEVKNKVEREATRVNGAPKEAHIGSPAF